MSKTSSLFLVFLICFNLYSNLALEASSARKKELISLLSARTEYVIDDVLSLLDGLLQTAKDELATLEEEWPGIKAEKQGTVDLYTGLVNEQNNQCNELSAENTDLADEIADTQEQIATDSARIVTNNDRVNSLLDDRCTQNRNYITGLKRNKQALAIIQILREAVNSFNPSLLEKKHLRTVAKRFINFLQFASKTHVTGLTQILQDVEKVETSDVAERTSEEIGTGHVDNTEEQITVADFDSQTIEDLQSVKTKLVEILDELEKDLSDEITENEANEAAANEELSDYQVNIENENNYLTTEIATLTEKLATLQSEKQTSDEAVADCKVALTGLQTSLENAEEDFASATTNYNDNNERLQEEVALFQEVYALYESEVASASEQLKEEVDADTNATETEAEENVFVEAKHTAKKTNEKKSKINKSKRNF